MFLGLWDIELKAVYKKMPPKNQREWAKQQMLDTWNYKMISMHFGKLAEKTNIFYHPNNLRRQQSIRERGRGKNNYISHNNRKPNNIFNMKLCTIENWSSNVGRGIPNNYCQKISISLQIKPNQNNIQFISLNFPRLFNSSQPISPLLQILTSILSRNQASVSIESTETMNMKNFYTLGSMIPLGKDQAKECW